LLGVGKGIAIYRGTRKGFLFGAVVNALAFLALVPWTNWSLPALAILNTAILAVMTGALALYCSLRLRGRIGPRPAE